MKIDFDIGHGKVGIEVKLARVCLKNTFCWTSGLKLDSKTDESQRLLTNFNASNMPSKSPILIFQTDPKQVFKTASLHRLFGQIDEYSKSKYSDNNLIVAVFGTSDEAKERVYKSKIEEKLSSVGGSFIFIKLPSD